MRRLSYSSEGPGERHVKRHQAMIEFSSPPADIEQIEPEIIDARKDVWGPQ